MVKGSPTRHLSPDVSVWVQSRRRRLLDIALAAALLVVTAPLMIVVALAVRLSSPGAIIFRQKRVGRNQSYFTIYKFRSMRMSDESGPSVTSGNDARITEVGRFIRRHKLDELPQLWNVLRGDMAIVGPRPFLPEHAPANLQVPPGLTGVGSLMCFDQEQMLRLVHSGHLKEAHDQILNIRHELDFNYSKKATFAHDLRVIRATLCTILVRVGGGLLRGARFKERYRIACIQQQIIPEQNFSLSLMLLRYATEASDLQSSLLSGRAQHLESDRDVAGFSAALLDGEHE